MSNQRLQRFNVTHSALLVVVYFVLIFKKKKFLFLVLENFTFRCLPRNTLYTICHIFSLHTAVTAVGPPTLVCMCVCTKSFPVGGFGGWQDHTQIGQKEKKISNTNTRRRVVFFSLSFNYSRWNSFSLWVAFNASNRLTQSVRVVRSKYQSCARVGIEWDETYVFTCPSDCKNKTKIGGKNIDAKKTTGNLYGGKVHADRTGDYNILYINAIFFF